MSTFFINRRGQRVDVICAAIGDVDVVTLTIDEAVNYDLFAVRGRTLALTFLTNTAALYYNSLRGEAITVKVDNVTIFEGVISSTPSHQQYNYKLERFSLYADDSLTATKYLTYATQESTLGAIFTTYLQSYIYTQVVNIDITAARVTLDMFTDTETTVFDVLTEVAKVLNIEISSRDGRAGSAIVGTAVAITPHYATTQLGVLDAIHAATVEIVEAEEASSGGGQAEEVGTEYTWGTLTKKQIEYTRASPNVIVDNELERWCWGLVRNLTFSDDGQCTTPEDVVHDRFGFYISQYYRQGTLEGVTYGTGCTEIQLATQVINKPDDAVEALQLNIDWGLGIKYPSGSPNFSIRTLIETNYFSVGGVYDTTDPNYQYWINQVNADLARQHVYFTRRYNVSVPPLTPYKTQHYIVYTLDVEMYPMVNLLGEYAYSSAFTLGYYSNSPLGAIDGHAEVMLRCYEGATLVYTATQQIIIAEANGNYSNILKCTESANGTWRDGVATAGYRIALPTDVDFSSVDAIEVDFMGLGGFSGQIYNADPHQSRMFAKYSGYPTDTTRVNLPVKYYSLTMGVAFASGYLEDTPPAEIDTTPAAVAGEEDTTYLYWNQDEGIEEVTLSNKLNSLIERAGTNTLKVGDGYLQKVTSTIYSGLHYVEEYQLATIIDQRSTAASVLQIDTFALNRLITYNSVKYRLCGYSYDLERGVYRCSYIEVKVTTHID